MIVNNWLLHRKKCLLLYHVLMLVTIPAEFIIIVINIMLAVMLAILIVLVIVIMIMIVVVVMVVAVIVMIVMMMHISFVIKLAAIL